MEQSSNPGKAVFLSVRSKILLGFLPVVFLFILNAVVISVIIFNSKKIFNDFFEEKDPSLENLHQLREIIFKTGQQTAYLSVGENPRVILFSPTFQRDQYKLVKDKLQQLMPKWSNRNLAEKLDTLFLSCDTLFQSQFDVYEYAESGDRMAAQALLFDTFVPLSMKVEKGIDVMLENKQREKQLSNAQINDSLDRLNWFLYAIAFLLALLSFFITLVVSNQLTKPVIALKDTLEALGQGDHPPKVTDIPNDEIGDMAKSLNRLIDGLVATASFARSVGKGDYKIPFQPLSASDVLGNSLLEMRDNLDKAMQEAEKRRRANKGQANFNDLMRKYNADIEELCVHVLNTLVEFSGLAQGSFFVRNNAEDESHQFLELKAFYAWDRNKFFKKRIEQGEGLVGQVWLEKSPIYLKEIPKNYLEIKSGTGKALPANLLIVPLVFNDELQGVLELASLKEIPEEEKQFIYKLAENLASTISVMKINEKTKFLLEQTQEKTEQLRAQEEEMRQNVEELQATQEEMEKKQMQINNLLQEAKENEERLLVKIQMLENQLKREAQA